MAISDTNQWANRSTFHKRTERLFKPFYKVAISRCDWSWKIHTRLSLHSTDFRINVFNSAHRGGKQGKKLESKKLLISAAKCRWIYSAAGAIINSLGQFTLHRLFYNCLWFCYASDDISSSKWNAHALPCPSASPSCIQLNQTCKRVNLTSRQCDLNWPCLITKTWAAHLTWPET